ncbi:MAG: methyltransferase domain-containing protein [Candidatus Moraniibacteriota bacterium]|nr:MAG: methyltransferase domain-containing protein [Candidatus Moranbacteria bacterium]
MNQSNKQELIGSHYDKYLDLYEYWSGRDGGGYHFGFARHFWEVLDNARMTGNLSTQVVDQLALDFQSPQVVLDAGCGVGHLGHLLAERFTHKNFTIHGITLSQKQVELANQLKKDKPYAESLVFSRNDFESTGFPDCYFDAIYFVDAMCYGQGTQKTRVLEEAYRILKPGGTLVVVDGFFSPRNKWIDIFGAFADQRVRQTFSVESWANPSQFLQYMQQRGFEIIRNENFSWKIAPSVLHVLAHKLPGSIMRFLRGEAEWSEVQYFYSVGVFAPLLGISPNFEYRIVVARKRAHLNL